MDKKYMERPKNFDKRSYNDKYQKEHYNSFSCRVKPELKERIDNYCRNENISKSEFLLRAIETLEK